MLKSSFARETLSLQPMYVGNAYTTDCQAADTFMTWVARGTLRGLLVGRQDGHHGRPDTSRWSGLRVGLGCGSVSNYGDRRASIVLLGPFTVTPSGFTAGPCL